jgi:intracellular sulfur oxidation DsrE/DsrF family protein
LVTPCSTPPWSNQLVTAGVTPAFIIGIRGKASNFFTKGNDYVLDIDLPEKEQIAALVKNLKALKIGIEQCRIAAGFEDIDVADFLPQVELVANGYVSMIGYQSLGYGFVPMD